MNKAVFLIIFTVLVFFWPVFLKNQVPANGPFLVSFFSPWRFEQWAHIPTKPTSLDQLRLYYPYLRLTLESWRKLEIPLWNPYNFSGNPHMAELQSGVFYPLYVFAFLSQANFWILMVISSFLLGALFTYLYLRSLKLGKLASYFGALTYSFSLVNICWSQEVVTAPHAALWLPLILWALDRFMEKSHWKFWVLMVIAGAVSVLSGYLQVSLYLFIFCFFYSLRFLKKRFWQTVLVNFGFLLSILMTSFQNFPAYQLYQLSARKLLEVYDLLIAYLLPLRSLITLLVTDFFGHPVTRNHYAYKIGSYYERTFALGAIPMIFLLFAFFDKKRRTRVWFFLMAGVVALAMTLDWWLARLVFILKIPLLSTSISNRTFFFSSFAFSCLGAIGLDWWLKKTKLSSLIRVFLIFSSIFLGLLIFVLNARQKGLIFDFFDGWTRVALRNSVIPGFASLGSFFFLWLSLKRKNYRYLFAVFIILFSLFQSYYSFQKYTPFSKREYIYPQHAVIKFLQENARIDRFWGYGEAFLDNNLATQFKIFTLEGYDSLNERRYNNLLWTTKTQGRLITQTSRSDAGIRRAPCEEDFADDKRRLRLFSLLGVRYLLDVKEPKFEDVDRYEEDRFTGEDFKLFWEEGNWRIFEYKKAMPRIFLASDYVVKNDEQAMVNWLYNEENDLQETLILEETISDEYQFEKDEKASVELLSYQPNRVKLKTKSERDQLLFISDTFYPGWQVEIDGEKSKIYRADFAFRAVPISSGEHKIEFVYWPESFKKGLYVSLASGLIFVTLTILVKRGRLA